MTYKHLVTKPFALGRVHLEGRQQARPDRQENRAEDHKGGVVTQARRQGARQDRGEDHGQDHGQQADAGLDGADVLDGLEPDGQVVDDDHHGRAQRKGGPRAGQDAALQEDARRDGGGVGLEDLDQDEADEQDAGQDEQGDDAGAAPGVLGAAPLQGEQEADDGGQEEEEAEAVELGQLLAVGQVGGGAVGDLEEDVDEDHGDAAKGEVDIKAPAPRDV